MSTGKRLAKRSILGTRVACSLEDGKYYPGVIYGVKTLEGGGPSIYSVRVEGDKRPRDLREGDLVGSCFTSVNSIKLRVDQKVFITYNNREVSGHVIYHRPNIDEVLISVVNPETNMLQEVKKRLEEVRLLESRKSARLADQDTDFAKLADCTSERNCRKSSSSIMIDVPGGVCNGSRKRRGSRSDEDLTDECAAALVLMKLSCSPRSPVMHEGMLTCENVSGSSSVSSGVWSLKGGFPTSAGARSGTPSPPLSDSAPSPPTDDGIEMDDLFNEDLVPRKRRSSTRVMFKCTWKDCDEIAATCHSIEQHIRTNHLGRRMVNSDSESDSDDDHEEEFYWTELEVNTATWVEPNTDNRMAISPSPAFEPPTGHPQAPVVSARPITTVTPPVAPSVALITSPTSHHHYQNQNSVSTIQFIRSTHPKFSLHSPFKDGSHHHPKLPITLVSSPPTLSHMDMARPPHEDPDYRRQFGNSPSILSSSWPKSSSYFVSNRGKSRVGGATKSGATRGKRNGESRKCRKVYGMEQKDQWCTQCKWKKACSRFGE